MSENQRHRDIKENMRPIIFEPHKRPTMTYSSRGGAEELTLTLYEATSDELIFKSSDMPFLRGQVHYKNKSYQVTLKDSPHEERQRGFYTFELEAGQELYVTLLKELDAEELTRWILEIPLEKSEQEEPQHHHLEELPLKRGAIAHTLEAILVTLYKKPWLSALLLILLTLFPAYQLKNISVDPSLDRVLVQDSPLMKQYKKSLELFGSDKSAILYFKDKDLFQKEKLEKLRAFAWKLQKEDKIARVRSVFTTTFMRYEKEEDTLFTEPLFQDLDISSELLAKRLKHVQNDPNLHGRLIDVPQKTLVFVLELNHHNKTMVPIAELLNSEVQKFKDDFSESFQTGEPTIELFQKEEMAESPKIFMPLITLVLLICFVFFLGSSFAFVITLLATLLSTAWAFGWMTYMNIPIQMMVNLVPGILLTLSATEIVHIASSLKVAKENHFSDVDSLRYLARDIGKALFLTLSTTALGFLSIRFSEIQILQEFSIVASLGLIFAFIITILYIPLHLRLFPYKKKSGSQSHALFKGFEKYFIRLTYQFLFSKKALLPLLAFLMLNTYFATQVEVDNDTFRMIANRAQVKKNLNTFKERMGGMKSIHAVLSFKDSTGEQDPKMTDAKNLKHLWKLHQELEKFEEVKHIESFAGLIAILNREMREGKEEYYQVPNSQNLISQYFIMLSRDDVDPLLSADKLKTNIKISHDLSSSKRTEVFIKKLEKHLERFTKDTPFKFHLTSRNILNIHAANTIISSQSASLITMSLVIVVLISLFFKSLQAGLLSLLPNLFPIFGLFGIMGLLNIPLNVGTCVVAAITIGIAADDTIHLFARYFRDKETSLNPLTASRLTIGDEVVPILTTSLSLALSFSFFSFARFIPLMQFGLLSAYVLLLAVISDLYLGPVLLSRYFLFKEGNSNFIKWMLIDQKAFKEGQVFHNLSTAEVDTILTLSRVTFKRENSQGLIIPLKNSSVDIYIHLPTDKESHLSPRTFEKICHNLKTLNLY